jgi:hypothetical protein
VLIFDSDPFEILVEKVKEKLPESFAWDPQAEPIRLQRGREQPQHSLEAIQESTPFFSIFAAMYSRYERRNPNAHDFVVNLWIFGHWLNGILGTPPVSPTMLHRPKSLNHIESLSSPEEPKDTKSRNTDCGTVTSAQRSPQSSHSAYLLPPPPVQAHAWNPIRPLDPDPFYPYKRARYTEAPYETNSRDQHHSPRRQRDEEFATVQVMLNGQLIPLQIQIGSLRKALDLC